MGDIGLEAAASVGFEVRPLPMFIADLALTPGAHRQQAAQFLDLIERLL